MFKKLGVLLLGVVFISTLSGCATAKRKKTGLEMQELKNQVSALEAQIQSKDEEIASLRDQLNKASEVQVSNEAMEKRHGKKKHMFEAKSHPSVKQIQIALQNAGYAIGVIDGKLGKGTIEAIKAFQKANNLPADGRVGKGTWAVLGEYLEGKKLK